MEKEPAHLCTIIIRWLRSIRLMRTIILIILLDLFAQTNAEVLTTNRQNNTQDSLQAYGLVTWLQLRSNVPDKLVDKLVDQLLKASPLNHTDLDETTLAKPHADKSHGTSWTRPSFLVPRSSFAIPSSPFPFPCSPFPVLRSLPISHAHSEKPYSPAAAAAVVRTEAETAAPGDFEIGKMQVPLVELLSTCIDACLRGSSEIRRVQAELERSDGEVQQVDFKIAGDPRSALTAADLAAQAAIVGALKDTWPGLRIVGEEDSSDPVVEVDEAKVWPPLRRDLCELPPVSPPLTAALNDITVFVDPLDGTREFVEGRVENVQTIVGVAVRGQAVAGAMGLPFADGAEGSGSNEATVVYALVGAGNGVYGPQPKRHEPSLIAEDHPLLVAGDTKDPALMAAYAAALAAGGRQKLLGATGQKILAVAEGRADVAIMNFKSSMWDTCAPEALIRTVGGEITDIFGERIVYRADPPKPATYLNTQGVIASSEPFAETHRSVCAAMRSNSQALERLVPWGLQMDKFAEADDAESATQVERVLRERREKQWRGQ